MCLHATVWYLVMQVTTYIPRLVKCPNISGGYFFFKSTPMSRKCNTRSVQQVETIYCAVQKFLHFNLRRACISSQKWPVTYLIHMTFLSLDQIISDNRPTLNYVYFYLTCVFGVFLSWLLHIRNIECLWILNA